MAPGESLRRMRWRLRGAWLWPTFLVATLVEMVLLHWLPVQSDSTHWISALLVAGCLNLIAIVVVGGLGGVVLRRRRSDLPKVVADDFAGTAALGLVAVALVVAGLLHHPAIAERRAAFDEQLLAVHRWVAQHGDAYTNAHVSFADTVVVDKDLFRTCVPGRDPKRWLCLIVDTTRSPPLVKPDPNREPNDRFSPRGGFS
ncbi:MAG: hypothetical protein QOF65_2072 [Thermoleophilaceae bacterium]|nr:hypothetical protein [Thermoleophilaceae bacterium]